MANSTETKSRRESSSQAANVAEEVAENILETGIKITSELDGSKGSSSENESKNTPKRPRKLTLSEFLGGELLAKKEEKRNSAFEKLTNKREMAKRLKNSAPCRHILNKGKCVIPHCTFAHSLEDLTPPPCLFEEACKKMGCNSIHPRESRDDWLKKMGYADIFKGKRFILQRDPSSKKEESSNRWDQAFPDLPKKANSSRVSPTISETPSSVQSKRNSFADITFSPRDKVIIIFPERFSDRKIKRVFEALVDIDICNIEIRRTDE